VSGEWSIARRLLVAHAVSIVVLTTFIGTALFIDARDHSFDETEARMLSIATTIADSPLTLAASSSPEPTALLQSYALDVTQDAGLDFITIMAPDRTRWTHPNPAELGRAYIGAIEPALQGTPFTEISTGTLGPSVRAVVPVVDDGGTVVALVAAGVTTSNVTIALNARLPALLALAGDTVAGHVTMTSAATGTMTAELYVSNTSRTPSKMTRIGSQVVKTGPWMNEVAYGFNLSKLGTGKHYTWYRVKATIGTSSRFSAAVGDPTCAPPAEVPEAGVAGLVLLVMGAAAGGVLWFRSRASRSQMSAA